MIRIIMFNLVEYLMRPFLYTLSEVGGVCIQGFLRLTAWSTNISGIQIWFVTLGWRVMYSRPPGSTWSGSIPFLSESLSSYQNIRNVVSIETVSATSFTSKTFLKLIEKFTLKNFLFILIISIHWYLTGDSSCGGRWKL